MRRLGAIVVVCLTLILFFSIPVVRAAKPCPVCGSDDTHIISGTYEVKDSIHFCFCTKYFEKFYCNDCPYTEMIRDEEIKFRFHSFDNYQDMGCSNGIHTWGKPCIYGDCDYVKVYRVNCPGPPHCVAPMSVGTLLPD